MKNNLSVLLLKGAFRKTSKLLLTACMALSLAAGWVIGSLSTDAFSQSYLKKQSCPEGTNVPSLALNGESLPTIILSEFSVTAKK